MKALLIAAAPVAGASELVARLAQDADLVIAVDAGGGVCVEAGVKPHLVVGDFDSIDPTELDWLRSGGAQIIGFPAEKDETDLELALDIARERAVTDVVVTAASAGRLDHTLAAIGALASAADLRPVLVEPEVQAWVLSAGSRDELNLQGAGAVFSVFAAGAPATVSIAGAKWPLERNRLPPFSGLGLGNEVTGMDGARITAHDGVLLVMSPHLADVVRAQAT